VFNRQPFNRGKFNTAYTTVAAAGGVANMALTGTAAGSLSIQMSESTAALILNTTANPTRKLTMPTSTVRLSLNTAGHNTRRLLGSPGTAELVMGIKADPTRRVFARILADMIMDVYGNGTRMLFVDSVVSRISVGIMAHGSRIMRVITPPIPIVLNASGRGRRVFFANSPEIQLELDTSGWADMYGYAVLDLEGLILPVGGELIIDTGQMTVTLNGLDVTRYVSRESEFFKLRPGDNIILYEDGVPNRNISYDILWKDLWL